MIIRNALLPSSPEPVSIVVPSTSEEELDAEGCLVLPGFVCGHTHLYSALARGMPPPPRAPRNFPEILELVWWRLDRALDDDAVHWSALVGAAEALRCGTTTLVDHHASPSACPGSLDRVADACTAVGVRSVMAYEVSDRNGPASAKEGVEENVRFLSENRRPLVRGLFGAHAMFTLSDATFEACREGAGAAGVGLHIHVAEDRCDADALSRFTPRPEDLLAHCVHADLAAVPSWVAHNARSNMNNAVGHGRLAGRSRTVLGTDGIGADMLGEMQAAFFRSKEAAAPVDPGAMVAEGRALAEGLFGEGALQGDLVVTDYRPPAPVDEANLAWHQVFALNASRVRHVVVAGEVRLRDRRVLGVDEDEMAAKAREAAARTWKRMEEL